VTGAASDGRREGGGGHPTIYGSSGEGEKEREMIMPSLSSLHTTLPLLHDVVCRQVGTMSGERQLNCPRVGTEPLFDSPGLPLPAQVTSDHEGRDQWDNGTGPFFWDLIGPGNLGRSGGGVLIESQRSQTPAQEGTY
jgi:hypothetical protein